jgi:hypothetical protein
MSKNSPKDPNDTTGLSWSEKKRHAAQQARAKKQREIEEANLSGDVEEYERLVSEFTKAKDERLAAKVEARKLKQKIKESLPSGGGRKWADNPTADLVRRGRNAPGVERNANTVWNMQAGEMVRLVSRAEAWTENYMEKVLGKGSIGILLDPPTGDRAAVMFGQDVFMIECKKLRSIREDD